MSVAAAARSRWFLLAVFVLSSSINYLDRTTLSALKPVVSGEFHLSNEDYGWIIAAFSIAYAASAPFAGMLIDRVGLNAAISLAVAVWSCAGIATGFTGGLAGLMACRAVLGLAEAAGFPAVGKAIHQYIRPAEHALAQAVSQAALSAGMMAAPVLATWIALRSGWRMAFVVTGVLGLVWIPVWNRVARRSADAPVSQGRGFDPAILRDHRLWAFAGANAIGMVGYSLWTQWTTPYLVEARHMSLEQSAWLAWIPPLFGALGGLAGGWLSKRLIGRGVPAVAARFRVCLLAAIASLGTLAIPLAPGAGWACAGISLSIAAVAAFSVNLYTMPLDTFGAAQAGFAISMLVMSYGVVQIFWPALGKVIDNYGYTPVISLVAFTPLAACAILWGTKVRPLKQRVKQWIFRLLGKDPEGVVATFCTGDAALCRRMAEEVRALEPNRRHFVVTEENWPEMRRELKRYRIGLAPVMLAPGQSALRRAAYRLSPRKILAYNSRLERHHLRLDLSSFLFWRGVPLDRIRLRPRWWPGPKQDKSTVPGAYRRLEGRPRTAGRQRVAVLSPYLPYPLSHGGAVRIFNLLRETAREFDVELFAFIDRDYPPDFTPLLEFCSRVVVVRQPRYREPRWSTMLPPEVHEFRSPGMRHAIAEERIAFGFGVLQVEYTQLAEYAGDVLVEHDVTFDLFAQVRGRSRALAAWWNYFRWRRFEARAVGRYRSVVVMSKKDAELLGPAASATIIGNGVDLERFRAEPETPGERLLFIGSFRHFPNIEAFRFFTRSIWPLLHETFPGMTVTVVCGADHLTYWRAFADSPEPAPDPRIRMLAFVEDVRPLYVEANLVIVPTTVSAGTNVKVLEAMAMQRAVVSTSSGCAGLGLVHGHSVWTGDTPEAFAAGIATLIADPERRVQIAEAAYGHARRNFDWSMLGEKQRSLFRSLLKPRNTEA